MYTSIKMSCLVHFITLLFALLSSTTTAVFHRHRRNLHQPFFPVDNSLPPTSLTTPPPLSSPQPQPKYPFSSISSNTPLTQTPFFPLFSPPPPDVTVATFPANISSLILPRSSSHSPPTNSISVKLIAVIILVSILSLAFITTLVTFLLRHPLKEQNNPTDSLRLVPPNATPSDGNKQHSHPPTPVAGEVESPELRPTVDVAVNYYQRLGSPELQPLPPLPRQHFPNNEVCSSEDDEYFSPRGSPGGSPHAASFYDQVTFPYSNSNSPHAAEIPLQTQNTFPYSNSISPSQSLSNSPSLECTRSLTSKSPDSLVNFLAPPRFVPPFPGTHNSPSLVSDSSARISESSPSNVGSFGSYVSLKWPPPPPPPPRFWEAAENGRPPVLVPPSRPVLVNGISESSEDVERMNVEESIKPTLKPLHWDKVRATSDGAMVWDHLKSCSFQLNEEMIEALFTVNSSNLDSKVGVTRPVKPVLNQENRVLDPKKSHNIAILLRALNVTIEEVCEALLEGNADTTGTELLESLLKMGPTKEEERKLMEFKDESPLKLGPAEIFLKAVLGIPFAFNRVDAMLYIANFDSEVEYLKRSFETLKIACDELRNSMMFLKLLEAVLKTGNRMNVGTNRGDACAFKLDTLLKLVDVKAADGKTTLLHFVVQEIIRAEGSRLSGADQNPNVEKNPQSTLQDEVEFRKIGLQVVSRLSGELTNVKKSAAMDSDIVSNDVAKLVTGISKITNVVKLNEELVLTESSKKFSESMNGFLKKAEEEIISIQAQEGVALSMVKELTEYFHGDSAKEGGRPLRIFMVVRDFLSILDHVCKDIGKMTERTRVSSGRQFPLPINAGRLPQFFAR